MLNSQMNQEKKIRYAVHDSVIGKVVYVTPKGLFLELDNGDTAYANFGPLKIGTKVYCTVRKKATGDRYYIYVTIDSVDYDDEYAACSYVVGAEAV